MASVSAGLSFGANKAALGRSNRVVSVDELRGLVMVLMALDHVREYFTYLKFAPNGHSADLGSRAIRRASGMQD